jgi:hypothetical protein
MDLQELVNSGVLSVGELNAHINNVPNTPTRISQMGLFQEEGLVGTNIVKIGISGDKLVLVPNVPRGAPAQPKALKPNNVRIFETAHLPQRSTVMADQLLNAFNPLDPRQQGIAGVVNALQNTHKRDLDYTIEYHRLGAIKGMVLDADGSPIWDLYDLFGVTQQTVAMALGTAATKVRTKVTKIKRTIEAELGGVPYSGIHAFVGSDFFDELIDHNDTRQAYERQQDGAALRDDLRAGFTFAGVTFEEVSGGFGATPFVLPDEGYAFPLGVPDMFITRFAPADYLEAVKGQGLPYYSKAEALRMNKGVDLESQSNPLNINTRPRAVIKLKVNA